MIDTVFNDQYTLCSKYEARMIAFAQVDEKDWGHRTPDIAPETGEEWEQKRNRSEMLHNEGWT